ncbi:MAG: hypothetical protein ACLFVU_03820 [Phycisphaerae bacterium]
MSKQKPILIGCPQSHALVRGMYDCDDSGEYLLGHDGNFVLARARCGQDNGRCAQTMCVLHRYNRRRKGSWYPTTILAMPNRSGGFTPSGENSSCPDSPVCDDGKGWLA